jgi:hypothetical protein
VNRRKFTLLAAVRPMKASVRFLLVSAAIAAAITLASWFFLLGGGTYTPYASSPGLQYSTLQKGFPFAYYSQYTLAKCQLSLPPGTPTGVCLINLPSTYALQSAALDFGFWAILSFTVLMSVNVLRHARKKTQAHVVLVPPPSQ